VALADDGGPIFGQIADQLSDQIADGGLDEGGRLPSTNELAAFYRVNPATAARALSVLAEEGLADKRRGIGMFVAAGARQQLISTRRRQFAERYVQPLVSEAVRLELSVEDLVTLVREQSAAAGLAAAGSRA
jgi:GntR family transcriptional regulator